MANPYANKIVINGKVKLDLSAITLSSANQLESGIIAHGKDGSTITGVGAQATQATTADIKTGKVEKLGDESTIYHVSL